MASSFKQALSSLGLRRVKAVAKSGPPSPPAPSSPPSRAWLSRTYTPTVKPLPSLQRQTCTVAKADAERIPPRLKPSSSLLPASRTRTSTITANRTVSPRPVVRPSLQPPPVPWRVLHTVERRRVPRSSSPSPLPSRPRHVGERRVRDLQSDIHPVPWPRPPSSRPTGVTCIPGPRVQISRLALQTQQARISAEHEAQPPFHSSLPLPLHSKRSRMRLIEVSKSRPATIASVVSISSSVDQTDSLVTTTSETESSPSLPSSSAPIGTQSETSVSLHEEPKADDEKAGDSETESGYVAIIATETSSKNYSLVSSVLSTSEPESGCPPSPGTSNLNDFPELPTNQVESDFPIPPACQSESELTATATPKEAVDMTVTVRPKSPSPSVDSMELHWSTLEARGALRASGEIERLTRLAALVDAMHSFKSEELVKATRITYPDPLNCLQTDVEDVAERTSYMIATDSTDWDSPSVTEISFNPNPHVRRQPVGAAVLTLHALAKSQPERLLIAIPHSINNPANDELNARVKLPILKPVFREFGESERNSGCFQQLDMASSDALLGKEYIMPIAQSEIPSGRIFERSDSRDPMPQEGHHIHGPGRPSVDDTSENKLTDDASDEHGTIEVGICWPSQTEEFHPNNIKDSPIALELNSFEQLDYATVLQPTLSELDDWNDGQESNLASRFSNWYDENDPEPFFERMKRQFAGLMGGRQKQSQIQPHVLTGKHHGVWCRSRRRILITAAKTAKLFS